MSASSIYVAFASIGFRRQSSTPGRRSTRRSATGKSSFEFFRLRCRSSKLAVKAGHVTKQVRKAAAGEASMSNNNCRSREVDELPGMVNREFLPKPAATVQAGNSSVAAEAGRLGSLPHYGWRSVAQPTAFRLGRLPHGNVEPGGWRSWFTTYAVMIVDTGIGWWRSGRRASAAGGFSRCRVSVKYRARRRSFSNTMSL